MADSTGISWTDHTFNIVWGCTKVSPGCTNCYADNMAHRWGHDVWGADKERRVLKDDNWAKPHKWNRDAERAGKRAKVFCGSMCDWAEDHPTTREQLVRLWPVIRSTPWLDWQLLTKRPERIVESLPDDWGDGWPNVWLGTSVENDKYLHRVDTLREIPAVCRFLSYEPALGPIADSIDLTGIAWLIYGGESGAEFRQDDADWARAIREKCEAAGVAFFYKQAANRLPGRLTVLDGREDHEFPERSVVGVSESSGADGITDEWTESDVLEETEVEYKKGDHEMSEEKTQAVEGRLENGACPDEASGLPQIAEDSQSPQVAELPGTTSTGPSGQAAENPNFFGFADHVSTLIEDIDIPGPKHAVGSEPDHGPPQSGLTSEEDPTIEVGNVATAPAPDQSSAVVSDGRSAFSITHVVGERVEITIDCDGRSGGRFLLDTLSSVAEQTISLALTRSGLPNDALGGRSLAVQRLLSKATGVALKGCTPGSAEDAESRAIGFLESPDLESRLVTDMTQGGFRADPAVGVTLYLCKLTALLDEPVYVYLSGPASSLKTSYADRVADLTPPEMLKHLTDLTPKALYYGETDLSHVVIALDEMDLKAKGLAMDQKLLRMLFSKAWAEVETTCGGRSIRKRVEGPVMVLQTTVATAFDEQDSSRHLLIELADNPERTETVLGLMGEQYAGLGNQTEFEQILETHRSVHRLLPPGAEICVPFAPVLARLMPSDQITVLRAFRNVISLVKASALLHIRHRGTDDSGRIVATMDDYRFVHEYAGPFVAQSIGCSAPSPALAWVQVLMARRSEQALAAADAGDIGKRALLQRLGETEFLNRHRRWDEGLSLNDLIELSERPRSSVQRYLEQLHRAGLVEQSKNKRSLQYRLATPNGELPNCPRLPSPEQVERGQLGTSDISLTKQDLESPRLSGQPTAEKEEDHAK